MNKLLTKINQKISLIKTNINHHLCLLTSKPNYKKLKYNPKISIITPIYNPHPKHLEACIKSVINQHYHNWELCLVDDQSTNPQIKKILEKYQNHPQIKILLKKINTHISDTSNFALKLATGDYIGLLDHDDILFPNALYEVAKTLNKNKEINFIYTDEDKLNKYGLHVDPHLKPDFQLDTFLSHNYICHFSVIRKKIINQVKGFRIGFEGSQDYDLFLRIIDITKNIYHLPKVLYSWRQTPHSTARKYSTKSYANTASLKTLNDYLKRNKINAFAQNGLQPGTFKIEYKINSNPLVSIIIPTKDNLPYLKPCIESILNKTNYKNYEILIINNNSQQSKTINYLHNIKNKKIKVISWHHPFNYSLINNFGATRSWGEYLLFLNNDTQIITNNWIEELLQHAQRPKIGAVGCKLLYPNNTIQHAGIKMNLGGIANSLSNRLPDYVSQPFPYLNTKDIIHNSDAITGACLMISKDKFKSVNGFNPKFKIAYNDVDLCLKLIKKGYKNTYTPYAKLFHFESVSISLNRDQSLFLHEQNLIKSLWPQYFR